MGKDSPLLGRGLAGTRFEMDFIASTGGKSLSGG